MLRLSNRTFPGPATGRTLAHRTIRSQAVGSYLITANGDRNLLTANGRKEEAYSCPFVSIRGLDSFSFRFASIRGWKPIFARAPLVAAESACHRLEHWLWLG
jgi:hypothetical protein